MGVFPLVARVGCLRDGAIRLLEEWSPIPFGGGQNPAYRPSGIFSSVRGGAMADPSLSGPHLWLKHRVPTIGDFRARALMAQRVTRSLCACATGMAAMSPETAPRPNRRTARSAGIS